MQQSTPARIAWAMPASWILGLISLLSLAPSQLLAADLNLTKTVIVSPVNLSKQEKKALALLIEEVEKRTLVRWDISSSWPAESTAVVAVGSVSRLADFAGPYAEKLAGGQRSIGVEGYRIQVEKAGRRV